MKVLFLQVFLLLTLGINVFSQCNNTWSKDCPSDFTIVAPKDFKEIILNAHNELRNELAGGRIKGFPTASRMRSLNWSDELAEKAANNVKQCKAQTDECHDSQIFTEAGQNVGLTWGVIPSLSRQLKHIIHDWWQGYITASAAVIASYPDVSEAPFSNFTVMANDKNSHVGCAVLIFRTTSFYKNYLLTCNYSIGNEVGQRTYEKGEIAANCQTGRNSDFLNLCSTQESMV